MKLEIIVTDDGSHTVSVPELEVMYHSRRGAVQESVHVFIEAGLRHVLERPEPPGVVRLFEMGLGTGLNALLTLLEAQHQRVRVHYTAVEAYPLSAEEASALNYGEDAAQRALLQRLHTCPWNEDVALTEWFTFRKEQTKLADYRGSAPFHLIYYDAFAPKAQPELWTEKTFRQLYGLLLPGGVLTTYCSKGDVRRAMRAAGLTVTKLPGPPGKREMVRAERTPGP